MKNLWIVLLPLYCMVGVPALSQVYNNGATITISTGTTVVVNSGSANLVGLHNQGTVENNGRLLLSIVSSMGEIGLQNSGVFHNNACAELSMLAPLSNSATFTNTGLFRVNTTDAHTNAALTNNGIIYYPQGNPIPNVTNNEIIIAPTTANTCNSISPAFGLGSPVDFTIEGVFTDEAATMSAGTYVTATNTFTPTLPLAEESMYSYFVRITDPVGGCTRVLPWDLTTEICITISGNIVWEHDGTTPVSDVSVTLSGDDTGNDDTDSSGDYSFLATGGDLTVTPTKNDNPRQGVDAADVARIRQHALGTLPFNDGYKVIAADVNENNAVTNADAVIIQQALMGNAGAGNLLDNPSWQFVDSAHVFATPNAPWGFPAAINLMNVAAPVTDANFVGVKMGDVNGTWGAPPALTAQPAIWLVADETLEAGSTQRVSFALGENLNDVAAWQFALRLDPAYATVSRITPKAALPLTREDFGTENLLDGELRTVFAQAQGQPLKAGEVVFELELTVRQGGVRLSEILTLDNDILDGRVYDTALKGGAVKLAFAPVRDKPGLPTVPTYAEAAFELYQNVPNPFADETIIAFSLPTDAAATITVHDASGRVVAQLSGDYAAGYNTVRLTRDALKGATGILTYTVTAGTYTATRRMLVVK